MAATMASVLLLLSPGQAQAQPSGCLTHRIARDVADNGQRRVDVESRMAMIAPATAALTLHLATGRAYYFACDGVHHMTARYWHTDSTHPTRWILQFTRWETGTIYP